MTLPRSFGHLNNVLLSNQKKHILTGIPSKITSRKIVDSLLEIDSNVWESVSPQENIYLSFNYLLAIEEAMKGEMEFYYAISFDEKQQACLISAFQIVTYIDKRAHEGSQFKCLISRAKSKLFTFNVIVCGNVFSDGENGFLHASHITKDRAIAELEQVSREIKKRSRRADKKASLVLFKEFWAKENKFGYQFKKAKYREFMIDVNMVLSIRKEWKSMQEYLFSLKKKYRSRANSVYRNSDKLELIDFSAEDIRKHAAEIKVLFSNVADKSSFSFGRINTRAFVNLKENLGDKFSFRGAFCEGKIVGFSTALYNEDVLEANYVGIDYEHNQQLDVYQRLLYDFIEQAILRQSKELHLGRTSELIKSAIGAVPENMNLYAKHNNRLRNLALKPIFHFIAPSKFELRQPFKPEFTT